MEQWKFKFKEKEMGIKGDFKESSKLKQKT